MATEKTQEVELSPLAQLQVRYVELSSEKARHELTIAEAQEQIKRIDMIIQDVQQQINYLS